MAGSDTMLRERVRERERERVFYIYFYVSNCTRSVYLCVSNYTKESLYMHIMCVIQVVRV